MSKQKYIVNPIQVKMKESEKGSVYESIVAMGFRARQINDDIKNEIKLRMQDIVLNNEEMDIISHNQDQIAISKEFENLPKPTFLAMKEIFTGKLKFHYQDFEVEQGNLNFD